MGLKERDNFLIDKEEWSSRVKKVQTKNIRGEDIRAKKTIVETTVKRKKGGDEEGEATGEDDCEAIVDDDNDQLKEEDETSGIRVDEKDCSYLKVYFGDVAREAEEASDVNSGDDIWDEDIIHDSLSSYDDEEAVVRKEICANTVDNEEFLFLEQCQP